MAKAKRRSVYNFVLGAVLSGSLLVTAGSIVGQTVVEDKLNNAKYFYNEYENDLTQIKGSFLDEEFYTKRQQELNKLETQKEEMDAVAHAAEKAYLESDSYEYDYIKANNEDLYTNTVKPLIDESNKKYNEMEKYQKMKSAFNTATIGSLSTATATTAVTFVYGATKDEKEF